MEAVRDQVHIQNVRSQELSSCSAPATRCLVFFVKPVADSHEPLIAGEDTRNSSLQDHMVVTIVSHAKRV